MSLTYSSQLVTNGLIFYVDIANQKSFTSTTSTTVFDMSNNLVGTLSSTTSSNPFYTASTKGALAFTGTSSFVNFGSGFTGFDLTDKTFQAWIYKTNANAVAVIDKDFDNTAPNYGGWGFWIDTTGKLWFWNHANLDLKDSGTTTIQLNAWSNVAVSYNSTTKEASFYINGSLNSIVGNTGIVEKASGSQAMAIGIARLSQGNINQYTGNLAICKGYNRALSSDEILQNYNALKSRFGL